MRKTRSANRRVKPRSAQGVYLVECLVAILIATILAFSLTETLASSLRAMAKSESEAAVNEILEELCEFTRSYGYERLKLYRGKTKVLVLNKTPTTTYESTDFHVRPLWLDLMGKQWQTKTSTNAFGSFDGKVTYAITDGILTDVLKVNIAVEWIDSYTHMPRIVSRTLTVFKVD